MENLDFALKWLQNNHTQAVRSIQKLAGLTACSYKVTFTSGERAVLREQTQRASNVGVNYQQEAQLLRAIAPLGFSPKPIYNDRLFSLLSWINGKKPTSFTPKLLQKLAEQLAKLHQFPLQAVCSTPHFAKLDLAERCQFLWDKLSPKKQQKLNFCPPFMAIKPLAVAVCHHDLHLGNFIEQNDTLYLIDWEYTAISDPALELALFLHGNSLSPKEKALFLHHYFAKNPLNQTACMAKMAEYQPLIAQLNQLWYAI